VVGRYAHARRAAERVPNFAAAVAALPEAEQRAVWAEAHALYARERFNNSRQSGVPRVPRPALVASRSLVDQWSMTDGGWEQVTAPVPVVDGASLTVNKRSARASPLSDVEVTFDFEAPADMAARGFIKAGVMGSATLWARKAASSSLLPPIARVALVHGSAVAHPGWTLVRRNLNKGSGGSKVFLTYRRRLDDDEAPLMGVALADADAAFGVGWRRVGVIRQGRVFVSEFGLFCVT